MSISRRPVRRNAPFRRNTRQIAPLDAGPREQQARHPLSRDSWSHTHTSAVLPNLGVSGAGYATVFATAVSPHSCCSEPTASPAATDRAASQFLRCGLARPLSEKRLVSAHTSAVLPNIGTSDAGCAMINTVLLYRRGLSALLLLRASIDQRGSDSKSSATSTERQYSSVRLVATKAGCCWKYKFRFYKNSVFC